MAGSLNPSHAELTTSRLFLRPLCETDGEAVWKWASDRAIADTTLSIPHPCTLIDAQNWIQARDRAFQEGKSVTFGIDLNENKSLIGAVGLKDIDLEHEQAELGFWIAVPWWKQGLATEAAKAVLRFGFESMKLNRIYAHHMIRNPGSGKVLKKIGMKKEGVLRERVKKWGVFEDIATYSILKREFFSSGQD